MPATFTELLPPTKSEKHGALKWEPDADGTPAAGVLTLTGTRSHCRYRVAEFPCDRGRGFVLSKLDAGTDKTEGRYACFVAATGEGLCECRGFHAAGRCKHLAAVTELVNAKRL